MAGQIKKRHNRRRNKMPKDNVTPFPIGTPAPDISPKEIVNNGQKGVPGFGWEISEETRREIDEIEKHIIR